MRSNKLFRSSVVIALSFLALLAASTCATAQEEKILASFNSDGVGGVQAYGGLIFDGAGNLYGTTAFGGSGVCSSVAPTGCGTVFELSPKTGGGWTKRVIHVFTGIDGYYPHATLIFDPAGNLYGTTLYGGSGACNSVAPTGCGVVFELTRTTNGGWDERLLHEFGNGGDGPYPAGGLLLDASGNLYGVTSGILSSCTHAPNVNCGAVFELVPRAGGRWGEKVLHRFSDSGADGYAPNGSLVLDASGNLYGGTSSGSVYGNGTAFELSPGKSGGWRENILYTFYWGKGVNGGGPGGFVMDAAGNLFGTTPAAGEVFELSPTGAGSWTQTILANFNLNVTGSVPNASLIFDPAGNLYGTNQLGGEGTAVCLWYGGGTESASCGTVFMLTLTSGGWTQTTLHSFGVGADGQIPYAGLIRDASGNLYGTTSSGGPGGGGVIFEITP